MKKNAWVARLAAFTVALIMLLGSFPGGYNVTIARSEEEIGVTDDEAARIAAEQAEAEEAAKKAAEEEAARKAAEEAEAARKAAEEEAARKAAEEAEAARKAAEEEAARKAAEEEAARKAAEEAEKQAEVSEKIGGEDADLGDSSDDDTDDFDVFGDFDDFDDFDEYDDGDDDGMIILDDWDAGVVSDELLDRFNNATNSYEQMEFNGTARIELANEGILRAGDEIRLEAKVEDVDLSYRLIWEANDRDDRGWYTIASGEKYSYTLTADNVNREYRVVLFSLD